MDNFLTAYVKCSAYNHVRVPYYFLIVTCSVQIVKLFLIIIIILFKLLNEQ